MALRTDSNLGECYDFAQMVNHGEIVLFDEPLVVYPTENLEEDCSLILETCSNSHFGQEFGTSESLYNDKFLKFENKQFQAENGTCIDENNQVREGLAMLEILHNTSSFSLPEDQPSYVDISEIKSLIEYAKEESPIIVSDDDDVIFVDCSKENNSKKRESNRSSTEFLAASANESKIRRNPVRSARNKSKDLSKDVLFEEDFAFLDTSDEETDEKENHTQERKLPQLEKYKEWPVNVHERPEYNAETKTIETFDYTIRDIQKKVTLSKKPRLETVIVKKKSKKKYGSTKRRANRVCVERKTSLDSVKTSVNETTTLLKEFFESSRESKTLLNRESENFSLDDKLEILKNQVTLYAAVNQIELNSVLQEVFYGKTKDS